MADIQGMFGQDPAMVQQAIQQQKMQQYQQAANMPQGRGIVALGAQAGGMLGDTAGSVAGYQDPRMADAQFDQQIKQQAVEQAKMQGIDPTNDPEGFLKLYANTYMQAGKPEKAYPIVQQLQAMQAQKSKMGLEAAQAQKALREDQYLNVPKGGSVFDRTTGQYSQAPVNPAEMGGDINNQWDAMDFLNKVNEVRVSGKEVAPGVLNKARAVYEMLNKPQVGPTGVMISPPDISHLNPANTVAQMGTLPPPDPNMPDYNEAVYMQNLVDKGVPEVTALAAVRKMKALPAQRQQAGTVFGRSVQEIPSVVRDRQVKQAWEQENRIGDDVVKYVKEPQDILTQAMKVKALVTDPSNPSALNASATLAQHLLEPGNQALPGEIKRLIGGGNALEQLRGYASAFINGQPSQQQVKWFVEFTQKVEKEALKEYEGRLSEGYSRLEGYKKDNPEINPGRIINAESLARYKGVPYTRTPEEAAKLPKGSVFYTPDSLTPRTRK